MHWFSAVGRFAAVGLLCLTPAASALAQQPDVERPAGAPRSASQPPTPAQQEDLARILEQLRAQSQAIDARVRSLEQTIERQNKEIERLQAGRPAGAEAEAEAGAEVDAASADGANEPTTADANADAAMPAATADLKPQADSPAPATTSASKRPDDPFASPTEFLLELRARYADRFGVAVPPQPRMASDYDDHSLAIKRWAVGQNRILSQPIEWQVRVLRVTASRTVPGGVSLFCAVDTKSADGIDYTFEVDMPSDGLASLDSASGTGVFTLVGIMDPRLSFSPEHERDDRWDRNGHVVGPLCVSDWRVQGLQLRPSAE